MGKKFKWTYGQLTKKSEQQELFSGAQRVFDAEGFKKAREFIIDLSKREPHKYIQPQDRARQYGEEIPVDYKST